MKIGISTSVIQRGKTGIAQYIFALLREFRPYAKQHEFTIFALENDLPLFDFASDCMRIVPVPEKFRAPTRDIFWHQVHLPRLARQLRLDVLHVPSYRRLIWQKPCALVATIHDLAPFHVSGKYDWKRMFYGRVIAKRLAHRQDRIIAISNNTAHDVQNFFGISVKKISVIYNGLNHERFCEGNPAAAKETIFNKHQIESPFFLYVARLEHPAKNHVRLIESFNQFKSRTGSNWKLVFGGSDWHGAEMIHQKIKESPFAREILSLGFVADEELPTLYRGADAFIYPSLFEGFGMPPVEAMACGCPVISSTRGSLGEVVGDAAIAVNPENTEQISVEMEKIAKSPNLRATLRQAGLARAQCFNWKMTAAEIIKIYERTGG